VAEWINPKYADMIAAMRRAQVARKDDPADGRLRVRGFVLSDPPR
jgi:hypothetical protein